MDSIMRRFIKKDVFKHTLHFLEHTRRVPPPRYAVKKTPQVDLSIWLQGKATERPVTNAMPHLLHMYLCNPDDVWPFLIILEEPHDGHSPSSFHISFINPSFKSCISATVREFGNSGSIHSFRSLIGMNDRVIVFDMSPKMCIPRHGPP